MSEMFRPAHASLPSVAAAPPRPQGFVEFRRVSKTYDGRATVVANLELTIAKGEFLTFLGPSGSGKTTSLLMLAGFELPTDGDILVEGRSLWKTPPYKRNMGIVFQDYALFPHMTVGDNVAFPLTIRKLRKVEVYAEVEKALDLVRLTGLGDRRPSELSGGQQQRVALARALVFKPDLVLMDEPLGALDKQLREQLQLEIKHIQKRLGVTVVYVTHDQSEALTMSDRIAVFKDGKIQQLATPAELYDCPSNAFVAQFIGESNQIAATITSVEGEYCHAEFGTPTPLLARAVNIGGVGSKTTISIRPERVSICDELAAFKNVLPATVQELVYTGEYMRVRVKLHDRVDFVLKLRNARGMRQLSPREDIFVGWDADDSRALDAPEK